MEEINKRSIKPEGFDIAEVVNALKGTFKTFAEALEQLYEVDEVVLTKEDLAYIDNEIFLCGGCFMWFDISEMEDGKLCEDCYEHELEEGNEDNVLGDE